MRIYRSRVFSPVRDPFANDEAPSFVHYEDGYLAVDGGRMVSVGSWNEVPAPQSRDQVVELGSGTMIVPGFVDTHLHAPQLEMIGSYGGHLLEWLNRHTFPTEAKFSDPEHARRVAESLFEELLANGTVTAMIFSTIHFEATEIFFREAGRRGFRAIIGKTMMDRNAPDELLEDPTRSYEESRELIERWHGKGVLRYAVTPRFAPTSSETLLSLAGRLAGEFPDVYVQTHVSENQGELRWVAELFPGARDYVDVYDRFGLLSERTILAHGVHLADRELEVLRERGARIAHCPNSNLFLGSGLFPLRRVIDAGVPVGLGSDIGAGTTPSLFNAMADAYKVQQVRGLSLSPFHLWFLATLGGARALSLDGVTGSLEPGKDADFLVLDLEATPLLALRTHRAEKLEDLLAACIFMGDDRVVSRSFVRGKELYRRDLVPAEPAGNVVELA
ncbi:MAG TPA: guanine deaminase [Thermoanaerobaculia bacterium]|nr:guanine deaminase [Thermoanaerobaculia bacterium]